MASPGRIVQMIRELIEARYPRREIHAHLEYRPEMASYVIRYYFATGKEVADFSQAITEFSIHRDGVLTVVEEAFVGFCRFYDENVYSRILTGDPPMRADRGFIGGRRVENTISSTRFFDEERLKGVRYRTLVEGTWEDTAPFPSRPPVETSRKAAEPQLKGLLDQMERKEISSKEILEKIK